MSKSVLKTTRGKFLMIQRIKNRLTLCAEEIQNEAEKAPLVRVVSNENPWEPTTAYEFYYNKNWYLMKAVKGNLKVVKVGEAAPFYFERRDLHSEQFSLQFQYGSKELYLSAEPDDGIDILTTTDDPQNRLIITREDRT